MTEVKSYIKLLFQGKGIVVHPDRQKVFDKFINAESTIDIVEDIIDNQQSLMKNWKIINRVYDIENQSISIPNATVGKNYQTEIDFNKLGLTDLSFVEFEDLSDIGLSFDKESNRIVGVPLRSGHVKLKMLFKVKGEDDMEAPPHEKQILLLINPDPKTLWKNFPSDKNAIFWKKDNDFAYSQLGEKRILAASKRGRSHQNVGSFRDDDFAFKYIEKTKWSIVAVADGAGSYPLSREGARLACNTIIQYFEQSDVFNSDKEFEIKIKTYNQTKDEKILRETETLSKQILYKAVIEAHNKIKEVAIETKRKNPGLFNNPKAKSVMDYFHTTLIFAMFKKYDFGYLILTFGVGDCPIAVMNKEQTQTTLLNWLDVGEFGGGTRFVTQTEIFHSQTHPMSTRFNFYIIDDFSYLFLMTDGIYDPKFVVEANLEKHEKWLEFLSDLRGRNEEGIAVLDTSANISPKYCLMCWMDFWNKGNHDDRTLAIVF
jgi:serine/threonine protein phosphatase PrpC